MLQKVRSGDGIFSVLQDQTSLIPSVSLFFCFRHNSLFVFFCHKTASLGVLFSFSVARCPIWIKNWNKINKTFHSKYRGFPREAWFCSRSVFFSPILWAYSKTENVEWNWKLIVEILNNFVENVSRNWSQMITIICRKTLISPVRWFFDTFEFSWNGA